MSMTTPLLQGDKVLYNGKEKVVTDVSIFESDDSLSRAVLRPIDDPDGEFTFAHPSECQIIGHLQPGEVPGWREEGPNQWVKE
jgi:hypothetical protein